MRRNQVLVQVYITAITPTATLVLGHTALAEDTVPVLIKQRLADMTGKEATVLIVDYAPGAASQPHVHPGMMSMLRRKVPRMYDHRPAGLIAWQEQDSQRWLNSDTGHFRV